VELCGRLKGKEGEAESAASCAEGGEEGSRADSYLREGKPSSLGTGMGLTASSRRGGRRSAREKEESDSTAEGGREAQGLEKLLLSEV